MPRETELFRFFSQSLPADKFHVVRFRGTEGLNELFSFTIDLVSRDAAIDPAEVLGAPASFAILRDEGPDAVFSGFPAQVGQGGHFGDWTYYTVELRPAFWKFTQIRQSAIFLGKNVEEVARELLTSQEFFSLPHEFRLTREYPKPEFAMQYGESLYDYLLWRLEERGAYFYFAPDGDRVVFADGPVSHDAAASTVYYSPATGLEGDRREEVATAFTLSQTPLPRRVVVRSYDWKDPNRVIVGQADVSESGLGDVYLPNENVASEAEAKAMAKIRAEGLICRGRAFSGVSSVPTLRPGLAFKLGNHYNPKFNREYLVTAITHEGSQESFLNLGLGIPMHGAQDHVSYRNAFTAIESDVPYRPARRAPRAKVAGFVRAFIDGAGSGARAEMDGFGRYKLVFPFDVSKRRHGNASCWIRLAQPNVGQDSGLSLPLLPGTEVLVGFIGGDPDRPVITGALANGETGAITGAGNANFSGLRTPGGNQITINDTDRQQGISILTANGHGLTMAAGSLDSALSATDTALSAASVASSDVAGLCKNIATGYKSSQAAFSAQGWYGLMSNVAAELCSAAGHTMETLSGKCGDSAAGGLKWGAEGAKLLGTALDAVGDIALAADTDANAYGTALFASDAASKSAVQVMPNAGVLLGSLLPWLLSRVTSYATTALDDFAQGEIAGRAADNPDKTQRDGQDIIVDPLGGTTAKEYYASQKKAALRQGTVSEVNDLLPELTAMITLWIWRTKLKAAMHDGQLGGISLKAKERNINLCADDAITQHSGQGVLLSAGDTATKLITAVDPLKGPFPPQWGLGARGLPGDFMKADLQATLQGEELGGLPPVDPYLALCAPLLYAKADVSAAFTDATLNFAKSKYTLRAGSKGATLQMDQKRFLAWNTQPGATLRLSVASQPDAKPEEAIGLTLAEEAITLGHKKNAALALKPDGATLQAGDKTAVALKPGNIEANGEKITAKGNEVSLDAPTIKMPQITIKGAKVQGTGSLSLEAGVIKIG